MNKRSGTLASLLYLIGNILTKALAFLTIPIFTRMLTVTEYGVLNTYDSWVSIAAVLVELSLYNSFRVAFVEKNENFEEYCASAIRLGGLLCIISLVFATATMLLFRQLRPFAWMIYCCLIQAYGMFCITSMTTKYMMQYKYEKRAFYMIAPNALCVGFALLMMCLLPKHRLFARIIGYVAVYVLVSCMVLISFKGVPTNRGYGKEALLFSLPLVLHGLSLVVLSSSDRIMITLLVSAEQSGVYSLMYNVGLIGVAVSSALEGIWIPWFSHMLKQQKIQQINEKAAFLIENISVVVIGVMLVAPEMVRIMADARYWQGIPMLIPIALASYVMFLYGLAVNVEYQCHATKQIAVNTIAAAVLNLVLNAVLIPIYGAHAAAYTTLASYVISLLVHYSVAKSYVPDIFPVRKYGLYLFFVFGFGILCNLLLEQPFVRWSIAIVLGCGYLYLMIARRRLISLQINLKN